MKPARVAYFALAPFISGSERSLQTMILSVKECGVQPLLVVPKDSPLVKWAKENSIETINFEFISFNVSNLIGCLQGLLKITLQLRKRRVNVLHSNQIWSVRWCSIIGRLLRVPVVCHLRDPIDDSSNWWLKYKATLLICISKHIEKSAKTYIAKSKYGGLLTLINPIKITSSRKEDERSLKRHEARKTLFLQADAFIFCFVGQVADVKALHETLVILTKLQDKKWQFIVAGEDNSENKAYLSLCQKLIQKCGLESNVKFLGFVDSVEDVYDASDLLLMLSKREPLGRVPLEAAGCYLPSVVNNVDGLPETIIDEKTGWLVDLSKPEDVAKKLDYLMTQDLSTAGLEARAFVERTASPEFYGTQLTQTYLDLIN